MLSVIIAAMLAQRDSVLAAVTTVGHVQAIVLGLLQGVAELFPISSLGHTVIAPKLLGWNIDQGSDTFLPFVVALHLGTGIALIVYFWKDWVAVVTPMVASVKRGTLSDDPEERLGWLVCAGTVPVAIIAVFFVLQKEVNLLLVTAVLTIAGYSLTDTVVVFDRIRENMHKSLRDPITQVFNRSINEVLSRTIVTSFTVFMAAASLFLFGGEVIHDFAFALLIGVLVGTYSTIFVASPIVALWEKLPAAEVKA